LIEDAAQCVLEAVGQNGLEASLNNKIKERLAEFLYEQTKRRPMILPVVMEI
jgi:mRNA degradation ribonuclease J1/J2